MVYHGTEKRRKQGKKKIQEKKRKKILSKVSRFFLGAYAVSPPPTVARAERGTENIEYGKS